MKRLCAHVGGRSRLWQHLGALLFLSIGLPNANALSVTLAWDPNSETDLAGYNLYWGTSSRQYSQVMTMGLVTTNTVTNLTSGVTYYFAVTAFNTSGLESDFSNEVSFNSNSISSNNAAPTLNAISNITLSEDAAEQVVTLSGITSGATNEVQNLNVTASSSNPGLIPTPLVTYTSPQPAGSLRFRPVGNNSGSATITVTVNDGLATTNRTFTVSVNAVNDAPTITSPARYTTSQGASTVLTGIQVSDIDAGTAALTLQLTAARGVISIVTNIPGGVTATHVLRNASTNVQINASLANLAATLANAQGVLYRPPSGFHGEVPATLRLEDNGNTGTGGNLAAVSSVSITVNAAPLEQWRQQYFTANDLADPAKEATTWGDEADPDLDGRRNLVEYALGLNPRLADTEQDAVASQLDTEATGKYLSLSFRKRKNAPQIQYVPEVSADRLQWLSGGGAVRYQWTEDLDPEFEAVNYQDLAPVTAGKPRFVRLRVTRVTP